MQRPVTSSQERLGKTMADKTATKATTETVLKNRRGRNEHYPHQNTHTHTHILSHRGTSSESKKGTQMMLTGSSGGSFISDESDQPGKVR